MGGLSGIVNQVRGAVDPLYAARSGNDAFQLVTNPAYGLMQGGTLSPAMNLTNVLHGRNVSDKLDGAEQTGVGGYYTVNDDGTYNILGNQGQDRGTMSQEQFDQYVQYGIDPSSKRRAENLSAALTREQFEIEKETFQPLEDYLLSTINNPVFQREQAMESYDAAQGVGDRYQAATERSMKSYGLQPTAGQQASMDRAQEFQDSTSRISAYNNSLRLAQERETQLLGAGLQAAPDVTGGQ